MVREPSNASISLGAMLIYSGAATMDVDKPSANTRSSKNRIAKRKKPSKIVFPKYSDRKKTKKR